MTRTIRDAELGWVLAGLRMLQGALSTGRLDDVLTEIATNGGATLPSQKGIDALCERLNMGDGMKVYFIHAYRQSDEDAPDEDIASLDWFVSAETPEEAVRLWREYLVKHNWLGPDEASQQQPNGVLEPPKPADTARVHEWPWSPAGFSGEGEP